MFKFKTIAQMKFVSRIVMGFSAFALSTLFLLSYYGQQVGNFTIDVSQDMYLNKEVVLSETVDFKNVRSRLEAVPIGSVRPIGYIDEPEKLPLEIENAILTLEGGSNNGLNYFAYTFYIKNTGEEDLSYNFSLFLEDSTNNIDEAIRVMVVKETDIRVNNTNPNITERVYAKVQSKFGQRPGSPEPGTTPFETNRKIVGDNRYDFKSGDIDKYSILMWLHGEDPDTVDIPERSIRDGALKLSIKFNVITI